jgi:DNA (cytosine-5)-methyltransferase 1
MKFLSVCSGIEAASVAWEPLGWRAIAFSEVDPFASTVLATRFPEIPNLGDLTNHAQWNIDATDVDILVGGTPCQSFSVAGLRRGLSDPRGMLSLVYLGLAARLRPRWIIWENVPGVLSADGGRAFGSFVGALAQLGYGFAYRVLDAQYFGVPQRRRRVFLVARCAGDWLASAEVLLEPQSGIGNPASRGEAKPPTAADARGMPEGDGRWWDGSTIAASMTTRCHAQYMPDKQNFAAVIQAFRGAGFAGYRSGFGTLRREGGDLGGGSETLLCSSDAHGEGPEPDGGRMIVRRLMPIECERLQGFPDGWTDIEFLGRRASDSRRYRALGNSMAVPCMRWIGERIAAAEARRSPNGDMREA